MVVFEVSVKLVQVIVEGYDLIVVNYVNFDMVGYIGSLIVVVRVCEVVDMGLGMMLEVLDVVGGVVVIIVDYGNCEIMVDLQMGGLYIVYMVNFVLVIVYNGFVGVWVESGWLVDVVLIVLDLMGFDLLFEMIGYLLIGCV